MSTVIRSLMVKVGADLTDMQKGLRKAARELKSAGKEISSLGSGLTTSITLPIAGAAVASIKFASDLEESTNKVNVAFQDSADEVKKWSDTTLTSFGIAKSSALDMASLFGDMGTAMGQTPAEAAQMSESLVGLAGDLASFKNIGIEEAETALKGIFTGEGESLKSLGVVMQDSTLEAYAMATGQKKAYDEMTQAEKVALRYAFVMDATKNAQGDFARTSGGTANQLRIVQESLKEAAATLGQNLLPLITPLLQKLNKLIQQFAGLDKGSQKLILTIAGIAAAIGPVMSVIGGLTSGIGVVIGSASKAAGVISKGGGLVSALGALIGPAGIALLAITAIAAAAYLIVKNWEPIKDFFALLWETVSGAFVFAWESIKGFFSSLGGWLSDFFSKWGELILVSLFPFLGVPLIIFKHWEEIKSFFASLWESVKGMFSSAASAMGSIFLGLHTMFTETLITLLTKVIGFGASLASWISDNIPQLVMNLISFFTQIPNRISEAIAGAIGVIGSWAVQLISKAQAEIPKVISEIISYFSKLPGDMFEVGKDLVSGLWDGMKEMAGWLKKKVMEFARQIIEDIKKALGISSPSKVMAKEVGKWIPAGIAKGITDNKMLAESAMKSLGSDLTVSNRLDFNASAANRTPSNLQGETEKKTRNTNLTFNVQSYADARHEIDLINRKLAAMTAL